MQDWGVWDEDDWIDIEECKFCEYNSRDDCVDEEVCDWVHWGFISGTWDEEDVEEWDCC